MRTIISKNPLKILQNKKQLEKKLNVKILVLKNEVEIKGSEIEEFAASRVIDAINENFPPNIALLLLEEDFLIQKINIKDTSRRSNLRDVRARVIGTKGRTINLIGELSDTYITINNNIVSVIGPANRIEIAMHALKALIKGSKQSSVYAYLEKQKKRYFDEKIEFRKDADSHQSYSSSFA